MLDSLMLAEILILSYCETRWTDGLVADALHQKPFIGRTYVRLM